MKCIFSIPVDNDNPIFAKRLNVIRGEEGANSARICSNPNQSKSDPNQSYQNSITTKSIKIQSIPHLHVFSWKLYFLDLNNGTTYFRFEEAPEAELSNTASDVVPANTLAPIRAAKPVARKAPICLIGKKVWRPKKFPPKESKCLNQHKIGDLYPNLAANIVVDYLVGNELGIGDASSLFYTAQLIWSPSLPC